MSSPGGSFRIIPGGEAVVPAIISRDDARDPAAEYGGQMAVRDRIDRWGDWALTLALIAGIEFEVAHPPAGLKVYGGRITLSVVALLFVLPLAWRRRAPLAVLATLIAWFAVATLVITTSHPGAPLSAVIALGVAFYTVGAAYLGSPFGRGARHWIGGDCGHRCRKRRCVSAGRRGTALVCGCCSRRPGRSVASCDGGESRCASCARTR